MHPTGARKRYGIRGIRRGRQMSATGVTVEWRLAVEVYVAGQWCRLRDIRRQWRSIYLSVLGTGDENGISGEVIREGGPG